jgi:hypothetical protein
MRAKFRIFSHSKEGLINGSFIRVIYHPVALRGVSRFINGDFMGYLEYLKTVAQCDDYAEKALIKGSVEFTVNEFKERSPECCR